MEMEFFIILPLFCRDPSLPLGFYYLTKIEKIFGAWKLKLLLVCGGLKINREKLL